MKLTEGQKKEICDFLFPIPRYRETFNEIYDHVINTLQDKDGNFDLELVNDIIKDDFAGYSKILADEELHQKKLSKKYARLFWQELLNTFKWPNFINNFIIILLCAIIYNYGAANFKVKILVLSSSFIFGIITIFGITRSWINKRKFSKNSIIDDFWRFESLCGISFIGLFLNRFIGKGNFFELDNNGRLIAALVMFFFASIYVRAYFKFYNQKIRVLVN